MEKTINCIEEKTAKNGSKYLIVDFTDKVRMSCWEAAMFPALQAGNVVMVESKTQGDYEIITSCFAVEGREPAQATPEPRVALMSAKDVSITAQCLTKCFASSSYEDPKVIMDAYRFFVLELEQNG